VRVTRQLVTALLTTLLLAGCGVAAPPIASPTPTVAPAATPQPTPTTSATPLATPTLSELPATPTPTVNPCATDGSGEPQLPPGASLSAVAGRPIDGKLGSFEWCGTSADAIPPKASSLIKVAVGDATSLTLAVQAPSLLSDFRATYWRAAELQGDETELAKGQFDPPVANAAFAPPPPGDWMLSVHLTFDNGGTALYYWHVTVP
jgi:hypothetical protein